MTKTDIVSMFKAALVGAGYDDARIRKNYEFSDLIGTAAQLRRIPLASFAGYPQSYRNACVGVTFADDLGGKPPNEFCALGAPLLLTVQRNNVQPWAAGVDGTRVLGQSFRLRDTQRVFREKQAIWGLEALGRVRKSGGFSSHSQSDIFDSGLAKGLERRFRCVSKNCWRIVLRKLRRLTGKSMVALRKYRRFLRSYFALSPRKSSWIGRMPKVGVD